VQMAMNVAGIQAGPGVQVLKVRASFKAGISLDAVLKGEVTPVKPQNTDEGDADPAELRQLTNFFKPQKVLTSWAFREAMNGSLLKRFKLSAEATLTWPEAWKTVDQIGKTEVVIMLEVLYPDEFPMEIWDMWKDVLVEALLYIFYLITGTGPKTALPTRNQKDTRTVWVQGATLPLNKCKYRFPWAEGRLNRGRTIEDIQDFCGGQACWKVCSGCIGWDPPDNWLPPQPGRVRGIPRPDPA
jgi:hypothetical protein